MSALEKAKDAEAAYREASQKSRSLSARRNRAVLNALKERIRPADIAVASGLSRTRIGQIGGEADD